MNDHGDREFSFPAVDALHAQGRHIDAEWERLLNGARNETTEDELASHRLLFFLGALSLWQLIQDADDDATVRELQVELKGFLAEIKTSGNMHEPGVPLGTIH